MNERTMACHQWVLSDIKITVTTSVPMAITIMREWL